MDENAAIAPPDSEPTLTDQLAANAAAIQENETAQAALYSARNDLWRAAIAAGTSAAEIGRLYNVEAQTVRWNLKRDAGAPVAAKQARHANRKAS